MSSTQVDATPSTPLLAARAATLAVGGAIALSDVTFSAGGDRVLLTGDYEALFGALTCVPVGARAALADSTAEPRGAAEVVSGELAIASLRVDDAAAHLDRVGGAPLDPALPLDWTTDAYVTWSARLGGSTRRKAAELAAAALEVVGLKTRARVALRSMPVHERRAAVLAQAIVLSPDVLVAESPSFGLSGVALGYVMEALARATIGRAAIVCAPRLDATPADAELARGATHVVLLARGQVVLDGHPAELGANARLFRLVVVDGAERLASELAEDGLALRQHGAAHFSVAIPEGSSSRALVRAVARARASVLEMIPVWG